MINEYILNSDVLTLRSSLAGESLIYIYLNEDGRLLLYSKNIKELLDDNRVQKPLAIQRESISFLLQSGVIPPPKTIYKNIYVLGIGDEAKISTENDEIKIIFSHKFTFLNENRNGESVVDEKYILEILAEATISTIKKENPSYLFHSAGKDSNTIALSLAEAGYQNKVTCITHKSKGIYDESEISKKIAKKLGFKHQILHEPETIDQKHINSIKYYFENMPLPCMDNVTLAYPLYSTQIDFLDSNVIDGMGNDVYMGHISSFTEYDKQRAFSKYHHLRRVIDFFNTNRKIKLATLTRSEWTGLFGLCYSESNSIFKNSINVYNFWKNEDFKRRELDYFDFRASIRGVILDQEMFTRKIRNFSDVYKSNLILPFTNEKVVSYFYNLPEKYLFDRKNFRNKLILREILHNRVNLNSDKLGKMAYVFDFYSVLMMMKEEVDKEILTCKLWNEKGITKLLDSFYKKIEKKHIMENDFQRLIQRLYLISAWYNNNRYVKRIV